MSDKIITLDNLDTFKTKIESEINDKQDKLPTVVNDRYLHTNSSTGALEWTSVSGGSSNVFFIEATVDSENATEVSFPLVFTTTAAELLASLSNNVTYALKLVEDNNVAGIFSLTLLASSPTEYTFIGTMKMPMFNYMSQVMDVTINLNSETDPATLSGSLAVSMNFEATKNAGVLTYSENDGYALENVTMEDFNALSSSVSYGNFKGFAIYYGGRIYNFESLKISSFAYAFSAFEAINNSSFYKYVLVITWTTSGNDQPTFTVNEYTYTIGSGGVDNISIVNALPSTSSAQNNILYKLNNDLYALTETEQVAPVISYSNGTLTVTCDYDAESIELYADNTLIDTILINGGNS